SSIYGVMAHFDTIADDTNDSPGADDNASGLAASLEIARVLAEYDLVHPVRIIFVNVEEVGIVGSRKFAENAVANAIPYEGVFNLDSIGAQRQYTYVVVNGGPTTGWMVDLYKRLNEAYGLNQTINAMNNEAIVADDNRLREVGIDSIMIGRELYGQSPYHHTSGDLLETISVPSVAKAGVLTLLCLASLAQG
ncbi:MAG TPA: M20/M25/M40 family metallo-hydrolase, partial [Thermomicrobiales bacterium]|nr:M20/M25/M40 family metallo-hydrolase [Thermomicrobiales bacterium]